MPVPTATIEHMFDIAVSAGDCDTPEATARELVNAARDADRAVRVAQARRAQMVVRAVLAVSEAVEGEQDLVQRAGEGVPRIAEFAHLELSAALGLSPAKMLDEMGALLDLSFRLPCLWQQVVAAEVPVWKAMTVAERTTLLSQADCRQIDCFLGAIAAWSQARICRHVDNLIARINPDEFDAQCARAQSTRRVQITHEESSSIAYVDATLSATDAIALDNTITRLAGLLADADELSIDERRSQALGILATPHYAARLLDEGSASRSLQPAATVIVHVDDSPVAQIDGHGSVGLKQLRQMFAHTRVTIRPVLDPRALTPIDRHDPSGDMRLALQTREPYEVFPYSNVRSRSCDIDHTQAFDPDGLSGQTRLDNLGPLSRSVHRAKTHAHWRLEQVATGVYEWHSPLGFIYTVVNGRTFFHRRE